MARKIKPGPAPTRELPHGPGQGPIPNPNPWKHLPPKAKKLQKSFTEGYG